MTPDPRDEALALAERCTSHHAPWLKFGVSVGRGWITASDEATIRLVCDWWNARYEVASALRMQADQWQPIETAPKDGSQVMLYGTQYPIDDLKVEGPLRFSGYWDLIDEAWCSTGSRFDGPFYEPTAWQPIPPPPVTREGGDG